MASQRLEQMRRHPQSDWTIRDVEALCKDYGIACEPPRDGGSHYKVFHPAMAEILTMPSKRPHQAGIYQTACGFCSGGE